MTFKWNMFVKVLLLLFFFLKFLCCFYHEKGCLFSSSSHIKVWIWYAHKDKIEKHYHYGGKQRLNFFYKSTYRNIQVGEKKDIFVILSFYLLRRTKKYNKKRRITICLFDNSGTQNIVKCHILFEEVNLDES